MRRRWPLLLVLFLLLPGRALAEGPNHVGLVVQFADGQVTTRCLAFPEPEITGEEVLRRSGLSLILDYSFGMGAAVCKIERDGCAPSRGEECFCRCQGRDCQYWAYFEGQSDGSWLYLGVGATGHTVRNGSMEGWAWTKGTTTEEAEATLPRLTFAEVCASTLASTPTLSPEVREKGEGGGDSASRPAMASVPPSTPPLEGREHEPAQHQGAVAFVALAALLGLAGAAVVWRRRGRE